jgi:putative ABC transport system substrate-binding protein
MTQVLIIGASKGIGLETTRQALEAGRTVCAFARSAAGIRISDPKLKKVPGDALRGSEVTAAVTGMNAVIQVLGVGLGDLFRPVHFFSDATRVLVAAMQAQGVKRLICVTGGLGRREGSMTRRKFVALLAGAVARTIVARAQYGSTSHIVVVNSNSRGVWLATAVIDELRRNGLIEGRNLLVEGNGIGVPFPRFADAARELAKTSIEAIVVGGGAPPIRSVQAVLPAIPIVGVADDMVADGLARSLAQPGGNVTGVSLFAPELNGKRQELLIELLPGVHRMAALADPRVQHPQELETLQEAARARRVELSIHLVTSEDGIIPAISAAQAAGAGGLNVLAASLFGSISKTIIAHTSALRLPAIYMWPDFAELGALIAYGPSQTQVYRQVARMLAKVLRGAKPADLPVEQPTTFELAINLDTAKAIGLTVPMNLLSRADKVI